jgi:hypothetical protein
MDGNYFGHKVVDGYAQTDAGERQETVGVSFSESFVIC